MIIDVLNKFPEKWLIENPSDGTLLILIPEGKFLFGGGLEDVQNSKNLTTYRDTFEVELPSFYIAINAITNAQYKKFIDETGYHPPNIAYEGQTIWQGNTFPAEKANHPVTCINWFDANAYCEWSGLRLPSELEWEKAARGIDGRNSVCKNNKSFLGLHHLMYMSNESYYKKKYTISAYNRKKYSIAEKLGCFVAEPLQNFQNTIQYKPIKKLSYYYDLINNVWEIDMGCSYYGLYQTIGNIYEWCNDWYNDKIYDHYKKGHLSAPAHGTKRVLRGNFWRDYKFDPQYVAQQFNQKYDLPFTMSVNIFEMNIYKCYKRGLAKPDTFCTGVGFRCAKSI